MVAGPQFLTDEQMSTARALNEHFGTCEGRICVGRRWLDLADPASFTLLGGCYAADAERIYFGKGSYWRVVNSPMHMGVEIDSVVDRASFEVLDEQFARDRERVYWTCDVLVGVSPDDFEVISTHFARTRARVLYFYSGIHKTLVTEEGYEGIVPIELQDADPETFEPVVGLYGRDHRRLFYHSVAIPMAEGAAIEALSVDIVRCGAVIYCHGEAVAGADAVTFEILADSPFLRDCHSVYFHRYGGDDEWVERVADADPRSFELTASGGRDTRHVYHVHADEDSSWLEVASAPQP